VLKAFGRLPQLMYHLFKKREATSVGCVAGFRRAAAMTSGTKPAMPPLTVISGNPRERGCRYGKQFAGPMKAFLQDVLTRNGGILYGKTNCCALCRACGDSQRTYSPIIHEEPEGIAGVANLRLEGKGSNSYFGRAGPGGLDCSVPAVDH
jgi:hypothetical protein